MKRCLRPLMTSERDDWLTPEDVLRRVVQTFGEEIALDPCSNFPPPHVPARRHFTVQDDGLARRWQASSVYMNPPYGRVIVRWVEKLLGEFEAGHTRQGIALVPARTDTRWFRLLRDYPVCFVAGRLRFSQHRHGATFPSAIFALGCDPDAFQAAFGDLGDIYRRSRAALPGGAARIASLPDHPAGPDDTL